MITIGIDSSTTNTAVVALKDGEMIYFKLYSPKDKDIIDRSEYIVKYINKWFNADNLTLVGEQVRIGVEAASFQSRGMRDKLTMLLGAIFYCIKLKGFNIELLPPSTIKKQFAGNGRASKDEMEECVPEDIMQEFRAYTKKTDDLVDAYAIASIL